MSTEKDKENGTGFNFKKWAKTSGLDIKTAEGNDTLDFGDAPEDFDRPDPSAARINDSQLLAACSNMVDSAAMDFETAKKVYLKASEILGEDMAVARQMAAQPQDIVTSHTYSLLQKMTIPHLRELYDFLKTVQ